MFFCTRTTIQWSVGLLELQKDWLLSFVYILENKIYCVCPSVYVCPPTKIHILFFMGISPLAYTNIPSNFHELQYQYIVRNSVLGAPLAVEVFVNAVRDK